MQNYPVELVRAENWLEIKWDDGVEQRIILKQLRDLCPCARCIELQSNHSKPANPLQILTAEQTKPLQIVTMKPVGNYAYNIEFSDGHDTGIYTFPLLRSLLVKQ